MALLTALLFGCLGVQILANEHGTTVFEFSRRYDTCNTDEDLALTNGTTRVVWAYHENDPVDGQIAYHSARGSTSVRFFEDRTPIPIEEDAFTVDMTIDTFEVPFDEGSDTTYWCKAFKTDMEPVHMVKSEPLITDGNVGIVHHILVYLCEGNLTNDELNHQGYCYDSSMPASLSRCNGQTPVVAWAIGGEAYSFPEHVGFPLGGEQYYVMEVHYDNPNFLQVIDGSGVRLTVTPSKRTYDAGILSSGWAVNPTFLIPPGLEDDKWEGWCTSNLTASLFEGSSFIDEDGTPYVKTLSTLLHAHTAGTAISLRHIRDGVEQPLLAEDAHYDFNFQDNFVFPEEKVVKAGDDIVTTCWYDTTDRTEDTPFGFSSREEMCLAYTVYYPATTAVPTCQYSVWTDSSDNEFHWASAGTGVFQYVTDEDRAIPVPLPEVPCERFDPGTRTEPMVSRAFHEFDASSYANSVLLDAEYHDEGRYMLYWDFDHASSTIHFAIEVDTDGWVGVGFSPTGGMEGADMVIGWITEEGDIEFKDRHATGLNLPPVDALQDFFDITGYYSEYASATATTGTGADDPSMGGVWMIGGIALGAGIALVGVAVCSYKRRKRSADYLRMTEA